MEMLSRQDAIKSRSGKYFTGKPCKSGHVTYRYTNNSACEDCVHPKIKVTTSNTATLRRLCRSKMRRFKFRVNDCDVQTFETMALGFAMMRESVVVLEDITSKWTPVRMSATKWIRAWYAHPDDEPALRALEVQLERAHDTRVELAPLPDRPDTSSKGWPAESAK